MFNQRSEHLGREQAAGVGLISRDLPVLNALPRQAGLTEIVRRSQENPQMPPATL